MGHYLVSGHLRYSFMLVILICSLTGCANVGENLIKATKKSDIQGVREALKSSPKSGYKEEALKIAMVRKDLQVFSVLVQSSDFPLEPALIQAARLGNMTMVNALLEKGTRVLDEAMVSAARNGNIAMLKSLLAGGGSPNAQEREIVPTITRLQDGYRIVGGWHNIGLTALGASIYSNRNDVATFLLEQGANPDILFVTEPYEIQGAEPIPIDHLLRESTAVSISASIVVKYKKAVLSTPLIVAIRKNNLQIIKTLVKYGADVNKPDSNGLTPAVIASNLRYLGYEEILRVLQKGK